MALTRNILNPRSYVVGRADPERCDWLVQTAPGTSPGEGRFVLPGLLSEENWATYTDTSTYSGPCDLRPLYLAIPCIHHLYIFSINIPQFKTIFCWMNGRS